MKTLTEKYKEIIEQEGSTKENEEASMKKLMKGKFTF